MTKTIVTGLDIGSSAIRLVVVEPVRGSRHPRILAQVKKESRGLRRGYIINPDEALENLRTVLAEAERQSKTRIHNVILGIGGITLEAKAAEGQVMVSKADQEIGDIDIQRAIAACEASLTDTANKRILHREPIACKVDGKKVPGHAESMRGNKLELKTLFTYCLNQHLNDLVKVVERAGLVIDSVVAAPVAASRVALSATQKAAGCVLANIGSQTTSLITFEEGQTVALQVLPIGANDITNDIALGLRLPLDEAERLKIDPSSALQVKRKLDEIIEARVIDMFELVDAHLKKIGRSGLLPAGIVIVGGGANIPDLERYARETLRLPARVFNPQDDNQLKNQLRDASWTVAYGLCLYGLDAEEEDSLQNKLTLTWNRFVRWFSDFWP
jgi:cell division protein FtsA